MCLASAVNNTTNQQEENVRLKKVVIDLEFKLRDILQREKHVSILRDAMDARFLEMRADIAKIEGRGLARAAGSSSSRSGRSSQEFSSHESPAIAVSEVPDASKLIPSRGNSISY